MTLDSTFRPLATKLLGKFGRPVTYKRLTVGAYDPALGESTNTLTDYSVNGFMSERNLGQLENGQNYTFARVIYISAEALGFEPAADDRILVGSDLYTVQSYRFYSSGAQDALYEITLSK